MPKGAQTERFGGKGISKRPLFCYILLVFKVRLSVFAAPLFALAVSGCFPFEYYEREPALVKGIDMRQSIQVATDQMHRGGVEQGLSIWALRDQFVTPEQAKEIGDLYLANIDGMKDEFNVWHTSWAIANLYKWGDQAVKASLETAFQKATRQPELLTGWVKNSANNHINGNKITTGFIHAGGVYYAHRFLVVPGDKNFLQSYEEYRKKEKR
jgi:hypothetical protein